ncbi:MAG: hypothetical protein KA010_04275, partial [Saprospiraceae bacterium]|nr:hypothetical protein [Saprospiraceae bacterium]
SGNRGQWIINHIDDHAWQYMKYVADEELFLRGDKNEKQEAFQRLCTSKGLNIALDLLLKNYATFNPALRLKFINIIHRFSLDEDGLQILTAIKKLEKSSHNIGILNSIIYRSHFSDEYEMINEWGRTMYDACVSAKKLYDLDFLHENYPVPDLNFQYGVDEEYLPLRNSIDQKRFFTAMTFINYEGWANHSDLKSFLKRISQELIVAISLSAIRYKNEVLGDILLREYMVAPTLILAVAPSRRYEYIDVLWSENDLQSNLLLMDLAFEENNAKLNPQLQKKILKWLFENELFIANNTIVEKCAIRIDMQTVVDIEKSLNQSNESRSIFAKIKQMVSEIKKLAC